jgi:hypothetical protein
MKAFLELCVELFTDHWVKVAIGAGFLLVGWLFGWWRAHRRWIRKEFFERVNFSLNSIVDGKLQIRTLMENSADRVFLNRVAVHRLLTAAAKTNSSNPLIPLEKLDAWFYLNSALNEISEKFAAGFVRRDAGQPVQSHRMLICLTNEADGEIRTRKIRVMAVAEKTLRLLPDEIPALESINHKTRWKTLQIMKQRLETEPWLFMTVEVVV